MNAMEKLVRELAGISKKGGELLEEHLNDNGEILAHVFMGGFTEYLQGQMAERNRELVSQAISRIENAAATGNESMQELLVVSFLENLNPGESADEIRNFFGPALMKLYTLYLSSEFCIDG